jgi:hypothetical protein
MYEKTLEAGITIAGLIAAIAIIALIISPKATTAQVIQSIASGYGNNVATAISPVTGVQVQPNLSYPNSTGYGLPQLSMGLPNFQ